MTAPTNRHFIYFADPMCSWCYGFAPVMASLAAHFAGRLPVRLVMGGLRAGNREPMRDKDRAYIRDAWARVEEASGQPFDLSFFDRASFTYDTEPACRAIVTMRRLAPQQALAFNARVSSAFYGHNRDITQDEVLADVAAEAGMERASFLAELQSEDARNETFGDFLIAKQTGVEGFPLLAAGTQATGYALVTQGFRPIDGLVDAIEDWLAKGAPVTARS
ncbi:MAG: DsbA family protein [Hyphomicrobiaceae bacterium]|nr:DsbA family protein [Hyphomicrobiaceae bacterium]